VEAALSLISVVQDVCAVVGVSRPSSIFSGLNSSRTQQELLALANEMAQRIAYDTRDWTMLTVSPLPIPPVIPTGTASSVDLPANFKRMLLNTNVRRMSTPAVPMRFIADHDEWVGRVVRNIFDARGEWLINANRIYIRPQMAESLLPAWLNSHAYQTLGEAVYDTIAKTSWKVAVKHTSAATGAFADDRAANPTFWTSTPNVPDTIHFLYLDRNCVNLASGGLGDAFTSDADTFRLDERLLKLGMIFQWKALKGSPYAEDMGTYEDALARVSGADKPAPTIIGRMPISAAASVAFPWPSTWGPQP
jgi:hypothetical protein